MLHSERVMLEGGGLTMSFQTFNLRKTTRDNDTWCKSSNLMSITQIYFTRDSPMAPAPKVSSLNWSISSSSSISPSSSSSNVQSSSRDCKDRQKGQGTAWEDGVEEAGHGGGKETKGGWREGGKKNNQSINSEMDMNETAELLSRELWVGTLIRVQF